MRGLQRTGERRRHTAGAVAATGAVLVLLAGCGSNGTSSADLSQPPPQAVESVQGTVLAPNGQLARRWWPALPGFDLVSPAYAQGQCAFLDANVKPVSAVQYVSLSRVDPIDAAHADTSRSLLINSTFTDANGIFTITDPVLDTLDQQCGLLLQVGSGSTLTRGFVLSHDHNDLDSVSEAVVRVVLDTLFNSTGDLLCAFKTTDLQNISALARQTVCTATGQSVGDLNEAVFEVVAADPKVQAALTAVVTR